MTRILLPSLTGNVADDTLVISAGTGQKVSGGSGGGGVAVGGAVVGATGNKLLVTDGSNKLREGIATGSLLAVSAPVFGQAAVWNGAAWVSGPFETSGASAAEATARANADLLLIPLTQKGAVSGIPSLDSGGKIPTAQLPASASQRDLRPETYGAGYGGSQSDDWGPAITKALIDAQPLGVDVQLLGITYGIRTPIVWPANQATGNPGLKGSYGFTKLKKLADVTLIKYGGTAGAYLWWAEIQNIVFDGGNNPAWTAPLTTNNFTEDSRFIDCAWLDNYGPAITARCAWDTIYVRPSIQFCGATDGVNPAVLFYSLAGDSGNATNNQWMVDARIEDYRTGALWCIGAAAGDEIVLCKLTGTAKIELSGGAPQWGPAIKLVHTWYYSQDTIQLSTGGTLAAGLATPVDVLYYMAGVQGVALGRMLVSWGGNSPAANYQSFFHIDASGTANSLITYESLGIVLGSAVRPTSLYLWTGYGNYSIQRGVLFTVGTLTCPVDSSTANPGPLTDAGAGGVGPAGPAGAPGSGGVPTVQVTLGASYTLNLAVNTTGIYGTLTANHALTVTGLTAGCSATLLFTQDGAGGHTLTINGTLLAIPTAPLAPCRVYLSSPNGTDLYIDSTTQGPQGNTGLTGTPGVNGSTWWTAVGAPGTVAGAVTGDRYLNQTSGEVYKSTNGASTWVDQSFSLVGPAGPAGLRQQIKDQARGLLLQTFDISTYPSTAAVTPPSQQVDLTLVGLIAGDVLTNLVVFVPLAGAGSGTAPTAIYLGVYSLAGALLAQTANLAANSAWTVASQYAISPLTAPFTVVTTGAYYFAFLSNGAFATTILKLQASQAIAPLMTARIGANTVYPSARMAAQATLPATVTFSQANDNLWFGVT